MVGIEQGHSSLPLPAPLAPAPGPLTKAMGSPCAPRPRHLGCHGASMGQRQARGWALCPALPPQHSAVLDEPLAGGGCREPPLALPTGSPAVSGLRYLQTLWRGAGKVSAHPSRRLCAVRTPGDSFPSRSGACPAPFSTARPCSLLCRRAGALQKRCQAHSCAPAQHRFHPGGSRLHHRHAMPSCVPLPHGVVAEVVCPGPSKTHRGSLCLCMLAQARVHTRAWAAMLRGVCGRARISCTHSCMDAPTRAHPPWLPLPLHTHPHQLQPCTLPALPSGSPKSPHPS